MKLATVLSAVILATAAAADLPVRQVVLYKHGVGYFERAGELKPGEVARLDFKPSEMDDVLKSLTIQDTVGGQVSGVRYDSSEPLAQRLASFPFALGDRQPLSSFLDTLKGARRRRAHRSGDHHRRGRGRAPDGGDGATAREGTAHSATGLGRSAHRGSLLGDQPATA